MSADAGILTVYRGRKKMTKGNKEYSTRRGEAGSASSSPLFSFKTIRPGKQVLFPDRWFLQFQNCSSILRWASNTVYSITKQKKNKEVISCRTWNWAKIKRTFNLHRGQILKIIIVAMACSVAWLVIISVSCYCESVGFSTILKAHISTFPLISSFIQSPIRWTNHCAISFIILLRAQLQTW